MNGSVRSSLELSRILALPRRSISDAATAQLASDFTDVLSHNTCGGAPNSSGLCDVCGAPMSLRPLQALALCELATVGGAFCPLEVGGGKTLLSLLAPHVLEARTPLLLLPAGLIEKTKRERLRLEKHWLIPKSIRLYSYEMLGRVSAQDMLSTMRPDLIVCDEVQKLKNRHAAVTRRVERWVRQTPTTKFVALSGTIMDRSLLEFSHLLRWALKEGAPIPNTVDECEQWAMALDERVDELSRVRPGALSRLTSPPSDDIGAVRRGFRQRLIDTPGVVSTVGQGEHVGASIYLRAIQYDIRPTTDDWFRVLRDEMVTPDEWQLEQGVDVWRHARELALGFHSVWDPRPPEDWRSARRAWFAFVRETLSRSRTLDSPEQVEQAVDGGRLPEGVSALNTWRTVQDSFRPNPVPIWHDDSALLVCAKWMTEPGIVWTEHTAFARKLSALTGAPYYGQQGRTSDDRFIDDDPATGSIIASADANREGRNLQARWSRNHITAPAENPGWWQQLIGRTHRPGQRADEVIVDVLLGCREHKNALRRAMSSAQAVRDTTGAEQKLLLADVEWPEIVKSSGHRW